MKPYDTELSKKEEVRAMFDNIAPAYDRLNHTLSLSVDRIWRRRVVRIVGRLHPRRRQMRSTLSERVWFRRS